MPSEEREKYMSRLQNYTSLQKRLRPTSDFQQPTLEALEQRVLMSAVVEATAELEESSSTVLLSADALAADDIYEDNDDFHSAAPIGEGVTSGLKSLDPDIFQIYLEQDELLLTVTPEGLVHYIASPAQLIVAGEGVWPEHNTVWWVAEQSGWHRIIVPEQQPDDYSLNVSIQRAPAAPTDLVATDGGHANKIELSWSHEASSYQILKFEVWRATVDDINAAELIMPWVTATTVVDESVVQGQEYFYWIRASAQRVDDQIVTSEFSASDAGLAAASKILWQNPRNGAARIWLMDGGTRINVSDPLLSRHRQWKTVGLADFNSDGEKDLLHRNLRSGRNRLWLMNGDQKVEALEIEPLKNKKWSIGAVADFDGDGHADILWRHDRGGWMKIWLMEGADKIDQVSVQRWKSDWTLVGAADFDGDGGEDLLWHRTGTGRSRVWLMDGTDKSSQVNLPRWHGVWAVAGVGDLDGDNDADLLWHHTRRARNHIWYMDGLEKVNATKLQTTAPVGEGSSITLAASLPSSDQLTSTATGSTAASLTDSSAAAPTQDLLASGNVTQETTWNAESSDLLAQLVQPRTTSFWDQLMR